MNLPRRAVVVLAVSIVVVPALDAAEPARAIVPTIVRIGASDQASARAAFDAANAADADAEIVLGTTPITLTDGELRYGGGVGGTHSLTLRGNGTTIEQAASGSRVLQHTGTGTLRLENVTISGGTLTAGNGGGVASVGPLVIARSTITRNRASDDGGGVYGRASVRLESSTVAANSTTRRDGGGVSARGALTLLDSTVSENAAARNGGGVATPSVLVLVNSTVDHNVGTAGRGGGLLAATVSATKSTITDNRSQTRGGGVAAATAALTYSTIAANSARRGANVASSTLTSFGSVVAMPKGGGASCTGTTATRGYNWEDLSSCGFGSSIGDRPSAGDPSLAELAINGGVTRTRSPMPGSGLVDRIPGNSCRARGASGLLTDQRGVRRPQQAGCDIGAVEVAGAPSPPVSETPSTRSSTTSTTSTTSSPVPAPPPPTGPPSSAPPTLPPITVPRPPTTDNRGSGGLVGGLFDWWF